MKHGCCDFRGHSQTVADYLGKSREEVDHLADLNELEEIQLASRMNASLDKYRSMLKLAQQRKLVLDGAIDKVLTNEADRSNRGLTGKN